ncbi:MAG: hypothetical protein ACO1OB_17890, partial [Archangium sp.]
PGALSQGGAMSLLDRRLDTSAIGVVVKGKAGRAEVLSVSQKGNLFAHHCRFVDVAESLPVWEAIASS